MTMRQNKIQWPFTQTAEGTLLFGPLGRYGTRYVVADDVARTRIGNNVSYACFGVPLAINLLRLIDAVIEANGLSREQRVIASSATCYLIFVSALVAAWFVFRQARGLTVSIKRPSIRGACAMFAQRWKPFQVWIVQGIAILLAVFAVFFVGDPHLVNRTIGMIDGSIMFAVGISVSLFCCYLLSIRNPIEIEPLQSLGSAVRPSHYESLNGSCEEETRRNAVGTRSDLSEQTQAATIECRLLDSRGK